MQLFLFSNTVLYIGTDNEGCMTPVQEVDKSFTTEKILSPDRCCPKFPFFLILQSFLDSFLPAVTYLLGATAVFV